MLDILKKWDQDETVEYDKMTRAAVREGDAMQVKVKKELFALFSRKEESIRIVFTSADQAQVRVHAVIVFLPLQQRLVVVCVCVCVHAVIVFLPLQQRLVVVCACACVSVCVRVYACVSVCVCML